MFEYDIVRYEVRYEGGKLTNGYQAIIQERARQGWRLVQIFAPQLPAMPQYFDIIFERARDDTQAR